MVSGVGLRLWREEFEVLGFGVEALRLVASSCPSMHPGSGPFFGRSPGTQL